MSTYVYCLTRASEVLPLEGAVGVGELAPPVRPVSAGDLTAVVSDAPMNLRPKRRDLATHEMVIERLWATGPVLPMRFGLVAEDDEAVRAELRSGASRYGKVLSRIEGHVELNVKGHHREDAILRDVLLEHPELAERNQALRAAGGGSHQEKVEFGERVANLVEDRRMRDAERALSQLQQHAAETRMGPQVDGCFVNASFLVAEGAQPRFEAALQQLRKELDGYANISLHGPLPPYSFVDGESEA